ncbi:hypothetical protein ACF05W_03455 [Streptomyces lydicus]|uniref:hypothetical protein n=1 Tax=Streptomyces lydicus TaxID=47763 RepID=UPI0036F7D193
MNTETHPEITDEAIKTVLREVVKESPEKVYRAPAHMDSNGLGTCFYVHTHEDGTLATAGCVVGTLLHRLGVSLERLSPLEGLSATGVLRELGLDGDSPLADQLRRVQMSQDHGATWAKAYAATFGEQA